MLKALHLEHKQTIVDYLKSRIQFPCFDSAIEEKNSLSSTLAEKIEKAIGIETPDATAPKS